MALASLVRHQIKTSLVLKFLTVLKLSTISGTNLKTFKKLIFDKNFFSHLRSYDFEILQSLKRLSEKFCNLGTKILSVFFKACLFVLSQAQKAKDADGTKRDF